MNIFITGGRGFLGSALYDRLVREGHSVVAPSSTDANLTNMDSLEKYGHIKYDRIYHLAAWTQAGDFCLHHAGEQWILNQKINSNVLDWWKVSQSEAKLICMGTSCAYAPNSTLKEDDYLEGSPIDSLFTYAMTKRMLYVGLRALESQFGLSYLCLVPSTLYGPGYHTDGRQMHFIFDLIRKIMRGKFLGESVVLWGDGNQRRELVYVNDFIETTLELSDNCSNELINIGAGEEFSIKEFARIICKYMDYDFDQIKFDETKYVGAKSKCLDTTKLKSKLPNLQLMDLDHGIKKTIDWFMANKDRFLN